MAKKQTSVFIHPSAIVETDDIGSGTRVWAFAHVMDGVRIGSACNICDHVFIESGACVGDRVTIKNSSIVYDGVTIEDDVFIGPAVTFTNDKWPRSPRMKEAVARYESKGMWFEKTCVSRGASLGARSVVVCGVKIAPYSMLGAGSVLVRDTEPFGLYVGSPAMRVGYVCKCGQRLEADLTCRHCARNYAKIDDVVRECVHEPVAAG